MAKKKLTPEQKKARLKKIVGIASGATLAKYLALKPFMPVMRASLKKKGISTKGKKLKEVSELFYKTFLMKGKQVKTNFDAAYYEQNFAGGTENFAVASTVLVKTIIEFISQIAKKKKEGKPLTAAEKQIDDAITETKTTQTNQAVGEYMPYIVGGVVILIFATIILTRKK